ncbi:probable tRNA (guanine(26)-N(2))-dimethyltransferase 1 [Tanacetum coccineum]
MAHLCVLTLTVHPSADERECCCCVLGNRVFESIKVPHGGPDIVPTRSRQNIARNWLTGFFLACIESHANRYKRYIVPVLSVQMDFYARVFVRIYTSACEIKNTPLKLSYVYQCVGCDSFHLQPLARTVFKVYYKLDKVVIVALNVTDMILSKINPPVQFYLECPLSLGSKDFKITLLNDGDRGNGRVLVTDMDPDELQSDLLALRRLYCLLINDEDVLSMTSLEVNLVSIKPGTTVTVKWRRN